MFYSKIISSVGRALVYPRGHRFKSYIILLFLFLLTLKTNNVKYFILFIIFIAVFAALFFVISLFGMLWSDYNTVITNKDWFGFYTLGIGWWTSAIVCADYYEQVIDK